VFSLYFVLVEDLWVNSVDMWGKNSSLNKFNIKRKIKRMVYRYKVK